MYLVDVTGVPLASLGMFRILLTYLQAHNRLRASQAPLASHTSIDYNNIMEGVPVFLCVCTTRSSVTLRTLH